MAFLPVDFNAFIGRRVAKARELAGINQNELAEKLHFSSRQILSNLEKGLRRATPEELIQLSKILGQPTDFFVDPYYLTEGKELFSWRAKTEEVSQVRKYEPVARSLISSYMHFSDLLGRTPNLILPQLALSKDSTYKEVRAIANRLAEQWNLGDCPPRMLLRFMQENLNIEVFFVDVHDSICGSSVRTEQLCCVLVNRNHSEGRRNFSLAHELFHILTWTTLHPDHIGPFVETAEELEAIKSKTEKLANAFASTIIMPDYLITPLWQQRGETQLKEWLESTSQKLKVSPDALFWRLFSLKLVTKDDKPEDLNLSYCCEGLAPRLYSKHFVEMTHDVIEKGKVSVRKVASLLNCTLDDLSDMFRGYSLDVPFDL